MNPKKILVVDDDAVITMGLSRKLKERGYNVSIANDGASAVAKVRQERPDLVLLDISFPPDVAHGGGVPWDGFLIIQWLRRLEEGKEVPIIVITGGNEAQFKDKAFASGAVAFFHKPIESEELLTTIRSALGEPRDAKDPKTP